MSESKTSKKRPRSPLSYRATREQRKMRRKMKKTKRPVLSEKNVPAVLEVLEAAKPFCHDFVEKTLDHLDELELDDAQDAVTEIQAKLDEADHDTWEDFLGSFRHMRARHRVLKAFFV